MLEVTLVSHAREKSVSVYDSDLLGNLIHMEAIVGTLVRYGSQGVYEPYLAKGWTINNENTEFKFFLNEGLFDEKGLSLNAESYFHSLHILLKKYSQTTEPPIFTSLIGWNDFKNSKSKTIAGIQFNSTTNSIEFKFDKPGSGLMEFLAMPYYGFYNADDFNSDGTWKDRHKITSTGGYKLLSVSDTQVVLQKRANFKLAPTNTYEKITINSKGDDSIFNPNGDHLLIHNTPLKISSGTAQLKTFRSTPTLLYLFELNPNSKIYKNEEKRNRFFKVLRTITQQSVLNNPDYIPARGFYNDKLPADFQDLNFEEGLNLTYLKKKNPVPTKYDFIADQILEELQKKYKIQIAIKDNIPGKTYIKPQQFPSDFDIRIKAADIGYAPENWVIKMMFCSDLGVSFADPQSKIKKLTDEFDSSNFAADTHNYADMFEKILIDQASLVPIFRDGYSFSITEGIDSTSLSQTTNVPRIDLIRPAE